MKCSENSASSAIGRAIGAKVGTYLLKKELNNYFRDYVFYRNDGDGVFGVMFGPMGSNLSGIGFLVGATGNSSRFSYTFIGKGNIRVKFPDGVVIFTLYKNGVMLEGRLFEKTYDPQTYRSFLGN